MPAPRSRSATPASAVTSAPVEASPDPVAAAEPAAGETVDGPERGRAARLATGPAELAPEVMDR